MSVKARKDDRRSNRTRRSLSQALVDLMKEKRFDDITVQDVLDRADVGRSTFYAHFRDKEDLFQQNWERFLELYTQGFDWRKVQTGRFAPVEHIFAHLQDVQHFYRGLVRSRMTDAVFKTGVTYLANCLDRSLSSFLEDRPKPAVPTAILAHFLASELFGLLKWWLDNNMPYSPRQMDEIFHELVAPGFRAALNGSNARAAAAD
jgi:AcrR family transcriptional regulator